MEVMITRCYSINFRRICFRYSLSIGLDYIPLKADVSDKTKSRTDTETSVTGTTTKAERQLQELNQAQAKLENHITFYANYSLIMVITLKVELQHVTLNTMKV